MSDIFKRNIANNILVGDIIRVVYEGVVSELGDEIVTENGCHYAVSDPDMVGLQVIGKKLQVGDKVKARGKLYVVTALDDTHAIVRHLLDETGSKFCYKISELVNE